MKQTENQLSSIIFRTASECVCVCVWIQIASAHLHSPRYDDGDNFSCEDLLEVGKMARIQ